MTNLTKTRRISANRVGGQPVNSEPQTYHFGDFTLAAGEHRLLRSSDEVVLRPKAFETLLYLVERHGHTVRKDELLDAVWAGTNVSDAVLTHCIAEVRQALHDDPRAPRFLKTLPKVGYAFIADVQGAASGTETSRLLRTLPERSPASAIAVLPFANLSPDPENEYLCDGLSEELINGLTKVSELHVVAHSSSFSFKGKTVDVREIGRQLGVGSVLEGSVRKSGGRLRVSVQLVDTAGGFHRWSEQYDRTLEDVFALQDDIARAVLSALTSELFRPARRPMIRPSTGSMEAYLLYLQGRSCWHRRFGGELQRAMECFEKAIQKDPRFALAYSGLAHSFGTLGLWAYMPAHDVFPRAAALARQALELEPMLAEAHASKALVHMFYDWDWAAAEMELARAIDLNPGNAFTHLEAGHYLSMVGRFEEAITEVRHAQALDPLSPIVNANVGWTYYLARQQDRAAKELLKVLSLAPGNGLALFYLAFVYVAMGRLAEAAESLRAAIAATGGMAWAAESIGWIHGLAGRRDEAHRVLSEALARAKETFVPSSAIAWVHLGLGDDDELFAWLEKALEEHDALMPWIGSMPCLDRLRTDSRFQRLVASVGL